MRDTAAIILAAGKSTRMKSDRPKVLHKICGKPMVQHVIDACREAGVERIAVVVGHAKEAVTQALGGNGTLRFVEQPAQKGTGHAVQCAAPALAGFDGDVLVIAGDMPLVRGHTLASLLDEHRRQGSAVTLATAVLHDPTGYGRIERDAAGRLCGIVEHQDCTPQQRRIHEVNISYYCFDCRRMFEALGAVRPNNVKGEYYLTDAVRILQDRGHGAAAVAVVPPEEALGINSPAELRQVEDMMLKRRRSPEGGAARPGGGPHRG